MLHKIRRKLTTLYTIVFGLFLLTFIAIIFGGILWGTYEERTNEIKFLASEFASENRNVIRQYRRSEYIPQEESIEEDYDISGQVFYYIVNSNGQVIKADLPLPILREPIYNKIVNWDASKDTDILTVKLPTGESATLLLAAHKVQKGQRLFATVYAGRDVTAYVRVIKRSILTVIGGALSFLIFAAIMGSFLARKVTIPIEKSIIRQKQFVADASHELRNPLSVLFSSIEAIEMDDDNVLSPFSREIMQDAKEEFSRLKGLVNDLLMLARTDTGDIKLKKEEFFIGKIAQQVIRSLKYAAEQKNIAVKTEITGQIEINADLERIHQLLYILIDNAIKYSPPISEVIVHFERVMNRSISYVKIIVEDTGPGIPLELQHKIFQRFFRVDEARSHDVEGAGLGLSIAKWIVDAHKGKIYVKSVTGKGSQFVILIPSN